MAKQNTYHQKLLSPKWQKKRLEILNRDKWACQICGDDENTLHVHHRVYKPGCEPWEYDAKLLVTLCSSCHQSESEFLKFSPTHLSNSFLEAGFFAGDFISIIEGLNEIKLQHAPEVVMSVYGWALSSPEIQTYLIDAFFKNISDSRKKREALSKECAQDSVF